MRKRFFATLLTVCVLLNLISISAVAGEFGGRSPNSDSFQGLTITCQEGDITQAVELAGQKGREIHIKRGGNYTVSGEWSVEEAGWDAYTFPKAILTVDTVEPVTLTLDNVTMVAPDIDLQGKQTAGIFCVDNSNVHIILQNSNRIDMSTYYKDSQSTGSAGIGLGSNAQLRISGTGDLDVKGGQNHPGIGALQGENGGNITINGGTISATGGKQGAGIGCFGGSSGSIGQILIEETEGEEIKIYAEGGENSGAGIGAGPSSGYKSIDIRSGEVTATATTKSGSWSFGAGIGGSGTGGAIVFHQFGLPINITS